MIGSYILTFDASIFEDKSFKYQKCLAPIIVNEVHICWFELGDAHNNWLNTLEKVDNFVQRY